MGMKVYVGGGGILVPCDHDSGHPDGGHKGFMIYVCDPVIKRDKKYHELYISAPVCSPNKDLSDAPPGDLAEMELPISPTEFFGVLVEYILDNAKEVKK